MDFRQKKWQSVVTVILFCTLLFGFTALTIGKPSAKFSETENRMLAQRPQIKAETVINGEFEQNYEEYLNDQFPFRDRWIGLKTLLERLLFKRETKDIYFADDGYFIEKHTGVYTTQMAKRNASALSEFVRQYEAQFGKRHLSVLIVPNAVDILKEKLPPFACFDGSDDYLKKLAEALPEEVLFNAAWVLQAHKEEELYYRTDHHWKTRAAFYVYQAWAKGQGFTVPQLDDYEVRTVTDSFEGTIQSKLGIRTVKDTIEIFFPKKEIACTVKRGEVTDSSIYDYDALQTKDKYAVFLGGNEPFLKISTDSDSERRLLIIKDSYANCFIPFLLEEFQEIDVLDLRYTNRKVSELIGDGEYTDCMVLYNASGFAEDLNVSKLTN